MQIHDPFEGEERYTKTQFWVEADSYAKHSLWECWHKEYKWDQISTGEWITIGYIDERPICVDVFWYYINDVRVGFYNGCSQLVDYKMIEDWFKKYDVKYDQGSRRAFTDASNFVHCLHALKELNKEK